MTELGNAKIELQALTERVAQLKCKIECMGKWEKEEQEAIRARKRSPRNGYCIYDKNGLPLIGTVRLREADAIRKFNEYKSMSIEYYGFSVGPCIVKPIIRA